MLFLCMFATLFTKVVELVGDPPSLEIVESWYFGMIILLTYCFPMVFPMRNRYNS